MSKRVNTAKWIENYKRWQINVQKDGKRKTFYSSIPGRNGQIDANRKADKWLNSDILSSGTRLNTFFNGAYLDYKKLSVSSSRITTIKNYYNKYIHDVIGYKKIQDLKLNDLQTVINKAYESGLSKGTLKQIKSLLSNILKYARLNNLTTLTCEFVEMPKTAVQPIEKKALTVHEIKTLLTCDEIPFNRRMVKDPYINIYRFILLTGLRRGECLALTWNDLIRDIDGNYILQVRRAYNIEREITSGKNLNAKRDIILNELAVELLEKQKEELKSLHMLGSLIFPEVKKGADVLIDPHYFYLCYRKYATFYNFGATTVHELRHTYITINKDLDLRILKKIVGHSESVDTLGVYSHEFQHEKERAAALTNEKFKTIING